LHNSWRDRDERCPPLGIDPIRNVMCNYTLYKIPVARLAPEPATDAVTQPRLDAVQLHS
jgi:hypothetical protein